MEARVTTKTIIVVSLSAYVGQKEENIVDRLSMPIVYEGKQLKYIKADPSPARTYQRATWQYHTIKDVDKDYNPKYDKRFDGHDVVHFYLREDQVEAPQALEWWKDHGFDTKEAFYVAHPREELK